MKKLTDSQRKWALTACLATVLSFNMVIGLSGSSYGSANFASNEPRFETVKIDGKELEVKFMADEDGKTVAVVPEKLESGWCYQCGEKYLLPKNFDDSTTSLKAALKTAMKDAKSEEKSEGEDLDQKPAKKVAKKAKPVQLEEEEEQQDEPQENADFAALRERCERKSEDFSKLRCLTTGLTKLLKNKKKVYDRDEVLDMYRSDIEPGLRAALADISDLIPNSRRSRYDDSDVSEDSSRREEARAMVEDMVAQITGKYNYLRERLTKLAANSALKNQETAQQKLKVADQKMKQAEQMRSSNPQYSLSLQNEAFRMQQEGYARMSAANQVANDLGISLYDGLDSAAASNYITGDQFDSLYYTNYANIVQDAIRGMAQNPLTYVLPNVTLADGQTVVDQNGQSYTVTSNRNPIVQSNGRNITVMMNNLTPANVANSSTPRIAVNAVPQAGSATIQVMQGVAAPVNQTNIPTFRARGQ